MIIFKFIYFVYIISIFLGFLFSLYLLPKIPDVIKEIDLWYSLNEPLPYYISEAFKNKNWSQIIYYLPEWIKYISPIENLLIISIIVHSMIIHYLYIIILYHFSEIIIKKYKLEMKYPKLAKFFQLRRKIQHIYIIIYFIIICVGLFNLSRICFFILKA